MLLNSLIFKLAGLGISITLVTGCAILHHIQIGEIDSPMVTNGDRFEILLSETGVNFREGAKILKLTTKHKQTAQDIGRIQEIISLFQMGPRTGNAVFNDDYADPIYNLVRAKCPTGNYSGLALIRETAKYPVVSGEIVKIIGYCNKKKSRG